MERGTKTIQGGESNMTHLTAVFVFGVHQTAILCERLRKGTPFSITQVQTFTHHIKLPQHQAQTEVQDRGPDGVTPTPTSSDRLEPTEGWLEHSGGTSCDQITILAC